MNRRISRSTRWIKAKNNLQVKVIWLVEAGTRAVLDLEVRPARRNEPRPARKLIVRSAHPCPSLLTPMVQDESSYDYGCLSPYSRTFMTLADWLAPAWGLFGRSGSGWLHG